MTDFFTQLLPLVGVVVGSAATILATAVTDRSRWKREFAIRWDEHRLNAYTEYASALKELVEQTSRITSAYRPGSRHPPLDWDSGIAVIAQADLARSKALERVLLLGDETTVEAAREWSNAAGRLHVTALRKPDDWDWWGPAVHEVDVARGHFYEAARASLTMHGALLPPTILAP